MDNTQDMKPQGQPSQDTDAFLSPEVEEDRGELHEAEPAENLPTEEGEKEMDTEPVPEQRAASAEGKVIEAEEKAKEDIDSGLDGPDAPGPIYEECNEPDEDSDDSHGEPEEQQQGQQQEQQQEQQPRQANIRRPQPRNRRPVAQRITFTVMQMQELERIFHRYPYPDTFLRQDIARRMHVTEARVQVSKPE
uniref:Homeobox domain-containing protein n=1 Tax=Myotis myotis TaxID=51298 RepID=A0A7J7YE47_MYOMY|nr:hypothetical protein mMyoMyo1_011026 [Myotis myotis]